MTDDRPLWPEPTRLVRVLARITTTYHRAKGWLRGRP